MHLSQMQNMYLLGSTKHKSFFQPEQDNFFSLNINFGICTIKGLNIFNKMLGSQNRLFFFLHSQHKAFFLSIFFVVVVFVLREKRNIVVTACTCYCCHHLSCCLHANNFQYGPYQKSIHIQSWHSCFHYFSRYFVLYAASCGSFLSV